MDTIPSLLAHAAAADADDVAVVPVRRCGPCDTDMERRTRGAGFIRVCPRCTAWTPEEPQKRQAR